MENSFGQALSGSQEMASRILGTLGIGSGTAMGSGSTSTVARLLSSSEAHTQPAGQMFPIPYGVSTSAHYVSQQSGSQLSDVPVSVALR